MRKSLKNIILLALIIFVLSSLSYARPMRVGGGLSLRYYHMWGLYSSEVLGTEGVELNPTAGIDLFIIFPVMQDMDLQVGAESIFSSKFKASDAPSDYAVGYTQIYLNGLLNWANIGAISPFCGMGINLALASDTFTSYEYSAGLGFQMIMGAYFGDNWRGELGWAWLNSTTDEPSVTAYSNVPYFKIGYVFNI